MPVASLTAGFKPFNSTQHMQTLSAATIQEAWLARTEAELAVDLALDVCPRKLQAGCGRAAALRLQPLHHPAERDSPEVRRLQRAANTCQHVQEVV